MLIAAFWLLIWQIAAQLVGKELLLPAPPTVLKTLIGLMKTAVFWKSCGATLLRVFCGFAAGIVLGSILGVVTAAVGFLDELLSPLRAVVKATPVMSFIILVLLYIKKSPAPMFIAFLMVLPIAWTNVMNGIKSTDAQLIEMADSFGFSRLKKLRAVYAPSVLPHFLSAATTGLGFAWKSGVSAEVIARPEFGMGRHIIDSRTYLETAELFAWTAAVVILSFALEKLMVFLLRRAIKWK